MHPHTALLVIDPQADFLPMTAPGTAAPALAAMGRLVAAARAGGTPVVFTQEVHRRCFVDFGRELDGDEPVHCIEASDGAAFVAPLGPRDGDLLVPKRRYSAFFATDLDLLLRGLGIRTVVTCGFLTDVCVHYTCVDAHQLDYVVHAVPDACAGSSPAAHDAALRAVAYLQAGALLDVAAASELLGPRRSRTATSSPRPGPARRVG